MLHTKFCGNQSTGSGEEDFLKGFYHMVYEHGGHFGQYEQHHINMYPKA